MSAVLSRVHLGVMGSALCHATYGWFGLSEFVIRFIRSFSLYITQTLSSTYRINRQSNFDVEL